MNPWQLPVLIFGLVVVTALGDYCIKLASLQAQALLNMWFVAGCTAYALSAFAWVYIFRHMKLASIGAIYSLLTIFVLATVGFLWFGETPNKREIVGLILAIIAISLLWRVG